MGATKKFLTMSEEAELLHMSASALSRLGDGGPPYVLVGERMRGYAAEDLDEWVAKSAPKEKRANMGVTDGDGWMTRQQCAGYIGISVSTLNRSDCPCVRLSRKVTRFKKSEVDEWLMRHR